MQSMTGKVKSVHVNFRIHVHKPGVGDVIYFTLSDTAPYPMSGPIIELVPSQKINPTVFSTAMHCILFFSPTCHFSQLILMSTNVVICHSLLLHCTGNTKSLGAMAKMTYGVGGINNF